MEIEPSRQNNFNALRLLFASLVIVSHSAEFLGRKDPLAQFTDMSFGQLAVAGFFLISGFLITESYFGSATAGIYLRKRVLRIFPAFLVASLICVLLVAPLLSAAALPMLGVDFPRLLLDMVSLTPPGGRVGLGYVPALPWTQLDVPMWTIGFEFRCYLLLMLSGTLGLLRRRGIILAVTAGLILARAVILLLRQPLLLDPADVVLRILIISPSEMLDLMIPFWAGVSFRLFWGELRLTGGGAAISMSALYVCCLEVDLMPIGIAVFGGYLVFWLALRSTNTVLRRVSQAPDISYGVYLYAWPIARLIVNWRPEISPVLLGMLTLPAACGAGAASWFIVERPALRWKQKAGAPPGLPAAAVETGDIVGRGGPR